MMPQAARKLLGVRASASAGEIKNAYRRLALVAHPDQGGSAARFIALKTARDALLSHDPERADLERTFCIDGRGRIRWYWRRRRA
jgi:DnaJ-class molecular chaperone